MLEHEFEKLTGLTIDRGQYEVINSIYMRDDNQTKQEFCKAFMEMGLMGHVNYVVNLKRELEEARMELAEARGQRDMWRGEYLSAKERMSSLETRMAAIAGIAEGGKE